MLRAFATLLLVSCADSSLPEGGCTLMDCSPTCYIVSREHDVRM